MRLRALEDNITPKPYYGYSVALFSLRALEDNITPKL